MPTSTELLQGTLDLLVLRTLSLQPMHGWGIAQRIQQASNDALRIGPGIALPGTVPSGIQRVDSLRVGQLRKQSPGKVHRLTAAGRKQLLRELEAWDRLSGSIALVLRGSAEARS